MTSKPFERTPAAYDLPLPIKNLLEVGLASERIRQSRTRASDFSVREERELMQALADKAQRGGSRVLVLEDEALLAFELAHALAEAGFVVVGQARAVAKALELVRLAGCDAAVLDINLGHETSEPVALELTERGTPFITLSGYERGQRPSVFADAPSLSKPLRPELLVAELRRCMGEQSGNPDEIA